MRDRLCLARRLVMPEEPCLERLKGNDEEAWEALVDAYHPALTRLVGHLLGGWCEDVPDVVQETLLRAYRGIGEFRGESGLRTWLYQIAANACRDYQKSGWRRHVVLQDDLDGSGSSDPTASVADRVGLAAMLARLPDDERVCLQLRFFHQLSGREIARVVGRNEKTVWSRVYSGLKRLRGALSVEESRVR